MTRLALLIYILVTLFGGQSLFPISLSPDAANAIAEKIWKNECAGTKEGLTHWNIGENFASLGIGHFIWYPVDKKERFQETFPALLTFIQQEGGSVPAWLQSSQGCPWDNRDDFYSQINSSEMIQLRQFLYETRSLQARFIAQRLEEALPILVENAPQELREKIRTHFNRLAREPNGFYALIDYMNFKGAGTSSTECYNGQGWGLLQVLGRMPVSSQSPMNDFVSCAKEVLSERVNNSPPSRQEGRWLKGWYNRLDTYTER